MRLIRPQWPIGDHVQAYSTTREGGHSQGKYAGLNLGAHVGDDPHAVALNRAELPDAEHIVWLNQVHGNHVIELQRDSAQNCDADASVTSLRGISCAVMTADCLPILLANIEQPAVAAVHAGWRGLAAGVIENTLTRMGRLSDVYAWIGPAIGADAFEVGEDVRNQFIDDAQHFVASAQPGKYQADLAGLARSRLMDLGVERIFGGNMCTYSDPVRFYSYRRDGQTGRMLSSIQLPPS